MEQKQQFQPARRHVFIVRIWREKDTPDWHGSVQHTHNGEIKMFRDFAELLTFVERFIERQAGDLTPVHQKGIK